MGKQYNTVVDMIMDIGKIHTVIKLYESNPPNFINWYQDNCRYYKE